MKSARSQRLFNFLVLFILIATSSCGPRNEPTIPEVSIGQPAPEIRFTDLSTGRETTLSSLKGKIVVADFWASWCGPCQEPMAKMQTYRALHPEWGDAVVLLAMSIDETKRAAQAHLEKKGWTNTVNGWIDPQAGKNPTVLAYAGKGIPATYVINKETIVTAAGRPGSMDISEMVKGLMIPKP